MRRLLLLSRWVLVGDSEIAISQQSIWQEPTGTILELPWKISIAKRASS